MFAYGNGGDDSATLRDSALADEFYGSGNIARLYDAAMLAYFYEAQGFDRVSAIGTAGGTNNRTIARPIDYALTFYGTWTGDPWP